MPQYIKILIYFGILFSDQKGGLKQQKSIRNLKPFNAAHTALISPKPAKYTKRTLS